MNRDQAYEAASELYLSFPSLQGKTDEQLLLVSRMAAMVHAAYQDGVIDGMKAAGSRVTALTDPTNVDLRKTKE